MPASHSLADVTNAERPRVVAFAWRLLLFAGDVTVVRVRKQLGQAQGWWHQQWWASAGACAGMDRLLSDPHRLWHERSTEGSRCAREDSEFWVVYKAADGQAEVGAVHRLDEILERQRRLKWHLLLHWSNMGVTRGLNNNQIASRSRRRRRTIRSPTCGTATGGRHRVAPAPRLRRGCGGGAHAEEAQPNPRVVASTVSGRCGSLSRPLL